MRSFIVRSSAVVRSRNSEQCKYLDALCVSNVYEYYGIISASFVFDHIACIYLGRKISADTECAGCRPAERTVQCEGTHTRTHLLSLIHI